MKELQQSPRLVHTLVTLSILWISGCGIRMSDEVAIAYDDLPPALDYNIDIKPILSDRCYHCHGPDGNTRKANVRLDTRDGLFAKNELGNVPFKSGSLEKSEVILRILSEDPEYMMPPPDSKLALDPKEKAALIKWVEDGANWKEHWAYLPPEKPPMPSVTQGWTQNNEIDFFVQQTLAREGLSPADRADKHRLLRRVTFDLTGLPPRLEDLEAFMGDESPDAYERVVNRLLSSTAHAERMALEWLDLARYADSHGFHADGRRRMWPWRDWVIEAFKKNMPYDQFVTEQLAGDLIPNASKDQLIATAFNRNHPMTAEGGVVDEEFRLEYVSNRTNTIGTAFLGLTLECAKCHDHKFDPISQKEYFQVSAFFNSVKELGMTGDDGDYGPSILLSDEETDKLLAYLDEQIIEAETVKKKATTAASEVREVAPILHHSFERITTTDSSKFLDDQPNTTLSGEVDLVAGISGTAVHFDRQDDRVHTGRRFGQFEAYEPFSVSLWAKMVEDSEKTKVLIGNAGEKNTLWRGWDMYLDSTNHLSFRLISILPHNYLHVQSKGKVKVNEWVHLMVSYDGSMSSEGVSLFINGEEQSKYVIFDQLYKSIIPTTMSRGRNDRGLRMGTSYRAFTGDDGVFQGSLDEVAVYDQAITAVNANRLMELSKEGQLPTAILPNSAELQMAQKKVLDLRREKLSTTDTIPELMVMQDMAEPRPTYVLERGEYDKPTTEVQAGTVEKVLPFADEYPPNRLGLSQWLFDQRNPLTARVAVNRYWQMIFGQGIVTTANDFGSQGALPTHPRLLDWLAAEFVESGWDTRHLLKLMVMSATYQQSSKVTKDLLEKDAANTWLARGPSYRWQAEFIRDNALAASGLLNHSVGGPSAKPYQPEGLWIELGNFSHFLRNYKQDRNENQYRRSMYTFVRRTSPPPNMTIFDAPNREVCTITRERTNTPLQALVLLNDPQFVEASKALAYRLTQDGGDSVAQQIETGFKLVLSRPPSGEEQEIMEALYEEQVIAFERQQTEAQDLLAVGDFAIDLDHVDPVRLAALTVVSNTLLNMDEAYMKR
ncbi:MAG: DUF1553 domain-containing protein [Bacteroidota bacterium]